MTARRILLTSILAIGFMTVLPVRAGDDGRGAPAVNVGNAALPADSWFNWANVDCAVTAAVGRDNAAKVDRAVDNKAGMLSVVRNTMANTQSHLGRGLMSLQMRQFVSAGSILHNPEVTVETSYSSLEVKELDIGGDVAGQSVTLEGGLGEAMRAGLTLSDSRIILRGPFGGEVGTQGADLYVDVDLTERLSAGCFATGHAVDVEEFNGNGSMTGAGLTLSGVAAVGDTDLVLTGALSRHVADIIAREYDTLANALFDVQTKWSDTVSTSAHAFFSDSVSQSRSGEGDRTFWSAGVGVLLAPNDRVGVTIGVDRTFALKELRDYRVHASLRFAW